MSKLIIGKSIQKHYNKFLYFFCGPLCADRDRR